MFSTTAEDFLGRLQRASAGIAKTNPRPILACFLLSQEGSRLKITGSNGNLRIVETMEVRPAKGVRERTVAVSAEKLMATVRFAPESAEVTVELDGAVLHVHAGNADYRLQTMPANEYPAYEEDGEPAVQVPVQTSELKEVLRKVQFAMAQGNHRYYLNGMFWLFKENSMVAVATNGHRLALDSIEIPAVQEQREAIVPREMITELAKLLGDAKEDGDSAVNIEMFAQGSDTKPGTELNRVRASFGSTVMTSQLIVAKYPDHERVLPSANENRVALKRGDLRASLRRIAAFSDHPREYVVACNFAAEKLTLSSGSNAADTSTDVVALSSHEGEPMDISLSGPYLEEVLDILEHDEVVVALKDGTSSVLIVPAAESATFKYVVMPVRT